MSGAATLISFLADGAEFIAHQTDFPHQEAPKREGADSTSALLVVAGVVVTLLVVGALVWVKERMRKMEAAERQAHPGTAEEDQRLSTYRG